MAKRCFEIRICEQCQSEYETRVDTSKFCSKKCMYTNRKETNWESITCLKCGKEFKHRKKDKKQHCSVICAQTSNQKKQKLKEWGYSDKNHFNNPEIQKKASNTKYQLYGNSKYNNSINDGLGGFRILLGRAKHRRKIQFDLSLEDLSEQWNKQNGKCVYSNVPLILPKHSKNDKIFTASLDRINSTKGYIKGNVQFVSICINYAKADLTHDEMIYFLSQLKIFSL